MSATDPGRFTRAALHSEAGELEARLSAKGNWELRIRTSEDRDWRLVCSGDLEGGRIAPQAEEEPPLRLGPITLDRVARRVHVEGTEVCLNRREFDLLGTLASQPNRLFTKAELLRAWGYPADSRTRTVDTHASKLRNKLRRAGAEGLVINYRGIGYKLWNALELAAAPCERAA